MAFVLRISVNVFWIVLNDVANDILVIVTPLELHHMLGNETKLTKQMLTDKQVKEMQEGHLKNIAN